MIGLEKVIIPTGEINQDFDIIKDYYQDKTGRYPEKQGDIRVKVRKKKSMKENEQSGEDQ